MKTVTETIEEQARNTNKEQAIDIVKKAIKNPTIKLTNGSRLQTVDNNTFNVFSKDNELIGSGELTAMNSMLISMLVENEIEILRLKEVKIPSSDFILEEKPKHATSYIRL